MFGFGVVLDIVKNLFGGKLFSHNSAFIFIFIGLFIFLVAPSITSKIRGMIGLPTVGSLQVQNQAQRDTIDGLIKANKQMILAQKQQAAVAQITDKSKASTKQQNMKLGLYFDQSSFANNQSLMKLGYNPTLNAKSSNVTKKSVSKAITISIKKQQLMNKVSKIQYASVWKNYCHLTASSKCSS